MWSLFLVASLFYSVSLPFSIYHQPDNHLLNLWWKHRGTQSVGLLNHRCLGSLNTRPPSWSPAWLEPDTHTCSKQGLPRRGQCNPEWDVRGLLGKTKDTSRIYVSQHIPGATYSPQMKNMSGEQFICCVRQEQFLLSVSPGAAGSVLHGPGGQGGRWSPRM